MSRTSEVLANKKRIKDLTSARNQEQIRGLRKNTAFRARLNDELKKLDVLFDTGEISSVIIEVPDSMIANFTEAMYSPDTAEFSIAQVDGEPNKFIIKRSIVMF